MYELYFTHFTGPHPEKLFTGSSTRHYSVRSVSTRDWRTFSAVRDVTPPGYVSPDAPVEWRGWSILAYQAYPDKALGGPQSGLFFSRRPAGSAPGGAGWSQPRPFLREVLTLPWNRAHRAIDPTLIVDESTGLLHCFFVGSAPFGRKRRGARANLLGHAMTNDTELKSWVVLTQAQPLIGTSREAPDGVENVAVFRAAGGGYAMIYSEGLASQHLARAISRDLTSWIKLGRLALPGTADAAATDGDARGRTTADDDEAGAPSAAAGGVQRWLGARYGAPYVWHEPPSGRGGAAAGGCYWMTLMGESELRTHTSAIGLLSSPDGVHWTLLPERSRGRVDHAHANSRATS